MAKWVFLKMGGPWELEGRIGIGVKFRVEGLGFSVQGLGYRVEGLGFRVEGFGLRV